MQIFIKVQANPFNGKSIVLGVEPDDTLENIKAKIQDKLGILPDLQILKKPFRFSEKLEHDDYTLKDYHIYKGDTLELYPIYKFTLCYVFYNDFGDKFEIKTYNDYDEYGVTFIKEAIREILGIDPSYQQLSFNGRILDDNSTIKRGVEIKLIIKIPDSKFCCYGYLK